MAELYPLAPCPFCGTEATFQMVPHDGSPYAGGHYVECGNVRCGASSVLIKTGNIDEAKMKLTERWNARVEGDNTTPKPPPTAPHFPVSLNKNWTGAEVQAWVDRNWSKP
jgi:hypothetical protein